MRVDLDAGEYAAFRFDPKLKTYRVEHVPPTPPSLGDGAAAAVERAPAWLRDRLSEQIAALGWAPIRRDTKGATAEPVDIDANGDGLLDKVRVLADGAVVYRPSRGPATRSGRNALHFHRDFRLFFPPGVGSAVRPAYGDDRLLLGDLDGELVEYPRNGGKWLEPIFRDPADDTASGMFAAPTLGDLDGRAGAETVLGGEDGTFSLLGSVNRPVLQGLDVGDFSSPCLADLDTDGDLDLVSGNGEGRIHIFWNTGTPKRPRFTGADTVPGLKAIDVGNSSAPAVGDLNRDGHPDLIVGNQEGELAVFLGPDFAQLKEAFAGLDVGELATPAFFGDALMVGNLDGDILLYDLAMVNGKLRFTERDSWKFSPDRDAKDLKEYYEKRYFREFQPLLGEIDRECRDIYVELLNSAPAELVDEIAFAIAHTPLEVLRAMARLGQADLLLDNARAVYEMAEALDYVRIEERDDYTTLAYRTAEGGEVTAPRDIYYWWVLHPRILYEIPLKIDASFWDVRAEDRELTDSEWWKTKPEGDIHDPAGKGVFWRRGLITDNRFGKSLLEVVSAASTLEDALTEIHDFLAHNSDGVALMRFGYETQDLQPWQIYAKYYGSCGEHSIIGAACARTMLVPMSVVSNRGEDHQWNEFWGTDGKWHHVDFCGKRNIDQPWASTERREHQGKTVSSVTRWRGDDFLDATTTTVYSPEADYTRRGTGYTDTADVTVRVADPAGRPVDGALIIVRSHWQDRNMITVWGYTGGDGRARFDLGYEPNGGYTIEALTPLGSAGVTNFPVVENETYELVLTTPQARPAFATEERFTSLPAGGAESDLLTARVLKTTISPPNLITAGRFRIGSWLTENAGYRGTREHEIPVAAGDLLEVLVFTPEEYLRFKRGDLCAPIVRRPLSADGRIGFGKGMKKNHVIVISNLNSLFLSASIEVAPRPDSVPEAKPPTVKWLPGPTSIAVASGESLRIEGKIGRVSDVASVWIRCSAWEEDLEREASLDRKRGRFSFELNAGEGGPMPPGPYTLTAVARGTRGQDGVSVARPLTVTPARSFKDQVIRQDDPADPLKRCSWILGPYVLGEGERFLLIKTKSLTPDFDMDMFLYFDKNRNGRLDGAGELLAKSTSPTANERIYRQAPKAGTYWLYCQGFSLESEQALLDVEVFPLGEIRGVVDLNPAGRSKERPTAFTAAFKRFAAIDRASVRILLDGEDVTHWSDVSAEGLTLPLNPSLPTDIAHRVSIRARHGSGREEIHEWTFVTDTKAPTLEILDDPETPARDGELILTVRAEDEGSRVTVTARCSGEKAKNLKPVKNRPGVFRLKLDTSSWKPGEHFILITARDAVGNETERVLKGR